MDKNLKVSIIISEAGRSNILPAKTRKQKQKKTLALAKLTNIRTQQNLYQVPTHQSNDNKLDERDKAIGKCCKIECN